MPDDHPARGDPTATTNAFQEWLQEAADEKDISEQELMDNLLSAYWIVNELSGFLQDSENTSSFDSSGSKAAPDESSQTPPDEKPSNTTTAPSDDSGSVSLNLEDLFTLVRSMSKTSEQTDNSLLNAEGSSSVHPHAVSEVTTDQSLPARLQKLETEYDDLTDQISSLQNKQESHLEKSSNELQLLYGRIDEICDQLEEFVTAQQFETAVDQFEGSVEETDAAVHDLEGYVEQEFDSIEDALRRLLDTLEENDAQLDELQASYQSEVEPILDQQREREQLAELRQKALHLDIRRAVCTNCDQSVDLSMLDYPYCPGCDRVFTDLQESRWWQLLRSPALDTKPITTVSDEVSESIQDNSSDNTDS